MDNEIREQYQMQDDMQQKQLDAQASLYAPQMQEMASQAQAVLVTETNPSKIIREIELTLRNIEEQPNGDMESLGAPLMNDEGIKYVKFMMRGIINQGTVLSHIKDDKQVSKLMINLSNKFAEDLAANWRVFDIDIAMLDSIHTVLQYASYMAILRALGQNEKNWLKGITVENISARPQMPQQKKGGFWDKFRL